MIVGAFREVSEDLERMINVMFLYRETGQPVLKFRQDGRGY